MHNTPLMRARCAAVLGCVAAVVQVATAQPVFKAGVDLVTVAATVSGRDRTAPESPLTAADFTVRENGELHKVEVLTRERRPVSLAIVLDSSGSMDMDLRKSLGMDAVRRAIAILEPGDEVCVVLFAQQAEVVLPWSPIEKMPPLNWSTWKPFGWSSLLDGVRVAVSMFDRSSNPNRAALIVSDGFENSSRVSLSQVVRSREQSEVVAYGLAIARNLARRRPMAAAGQSESAAIGLGAPPDDYLQELVDGTGGTLSHIQDASELERSINRIAEEWRNQYVIGYVPSKAPDGRYRRIKVDVERRGLSVRHRQGYLAAPK